MRILATPVIPLSSHGPWSLAGRFISACPWVAAIVVFCVTWTFRSFVFSGDGDQIARFIEAGYWMVQSELLSQMAFQIAYQLLHPFGWDGLSVIQLVTCLSAAVVTWIVIHFSNTFLRIDPLWAVALLFSSCFLILATGHTEYYTQFWIGMTLYGFTGALYLHNRCKIHWVGLAYSLGVLLHMGMLFALPSVLILPILRNAILDYKPLLLGLIPAGAALLFKEYSDFIGIRIQGLSPSTNFVPIFEDPIGTRFYFMFHWGHWFDIAYAASTRLSIVVPLLVLSLMFFGWRSLLRSDRLFLFIYALCLTAFSLIWHPNLGIHQDWDLFSFDLVPYTLLVLTYIPEWIEQRQLRLVLASALVIGMLAFFPHVLDQTRFGYRGFGSASITLVTPADASLTINGKAKPQTTTPLRTNHHAAKVIDRTNRRVFDYIVYVAPQTHTKVVIKNSEPLP